jgi:hypothetical protein
VVATGTAEGPGAERRASAARPGLPCLLSNNCTTEEKPEPVNILKGGHKRMAQVLFLEIMALVAFYGIERIGFFTLTFADHVTGLREAQRRFRSIRAHVIVKRYERAIVVWERHESGRIHFHLVVVLAEDIRSGADFAAFKRKDYRSANRALRGEWAFWRVTCPKYRFGRHELMPIKSNAQGIARYVGKYIAKHIRQRLEEDKGARLVRFIGYKAGGQDGKLQVFVEQRECLALAAQGGGLRQAVRGDGPGRDAEQVRAALGVPAVPGDSGGAIGGHCFSIGIGCDEVPRQ